MAKGEQKGNRESKKPKKKRSKQLLQRRVKRARQRVGSQTLDQARRSRNKRLASLGRFVWCCPRTLQRNFGRSGRFFIVGYDADIISRSER